MSEAPRWNGEALPVDVHATLMRETPYELISQDRVVLGQPRPMRPSVEGMVIVMGEHRFEANLESESL